MLNSDCAGENMQYFVKSTITAIALISVLAGCYETDTGRRLNQGDAQTATGKTEAVSIILHPDTDHGTCSIGLRVNAGGAELRSGPGVGFPVIATLKAGHVVSGCNEQNGWDGIIDGKSETCSVGIMVNTERPYTGPCKSGWIDQRFLTSIYG